MTTSNPETPRAEDGSSLVAGEGGDAAREDQAAPAARAASLLTLDDVAARFQIAPDVRALKRIITERKIPYVRIKREWRLTEDQFAQLREALTRHPGSGGSAPVVHTVAGARYGSARNGATSKSILLDAVTEQLQKHARARR
jgi:hypothetical protein